MARQSQGRPHWRLLGQMSRQQRTAAQTEQGIGFMSLNSALRRQYIKLSECAEIGIWPSELEMRDAHLKVMYSPLALPESADSPASRLLTRNAAVFLYSFGSPKRYSAIGPFNAIIGLSEPMLAEHLKPKAGAN